MRPLRHGATGKDEELPGSYLESDRQKEAAYMRDHEYRFREIVSVLPVSSESLRVLDIGTTPNTLRIKKLRPGFDVWTVDLTDLLRDRCESIGVQVRTCGLANESLPFVDGYFDLVVFTEVLEHLFCPPSAVLREIRLVLRDNGSMILSVPNIATLYNRIKLLLGATPLPSPDGQMMRGWVHGYGHIHEYTAKEIASVLEGSGFKIVSRRLLQERISTVLNDDGTSGLHTALRVVCGAAAFIIPSFRTTILLHCNAA